MAEPRILGIVLAGGEGKRLAPLTNDRAKPAVPFAGLYRLIDFALSNLANGGIRKICVLTQYKSHSLDRHIATTWRMPALFSDYVMSVPASEIVGSASAPPDEAPTERDLAWFFKLFSLRGIIDGEERMCFFTYLQKSDEGGW